MERDSVREDTYRLLQRLEPGALHSLGDELLPNILAGLDDLKPFGYNTEGKTRKGVPDSYVGESPETCTAGVEYTTKKDDLGSKRWQDSRLRRR